MSVSCLLYLLRVAEDIKNARNDKRKVENVMHSVRTAVNDRKAHHQLS